MSDSNMPNTESEWPDFNTSSDQSEVNVTDPVKYPSCMPGVVVYTKGHNSRHKEVSEEIDEQKELSAALDVALNAVRKVRNKSTPDHDLHPRIVNQATSERDTASVSNVIPIGEMPLIVGATLQEELCDGPAPVAPFAPLDDFGNETAANGGETDYVGDTFEEDEHYDEHEAVSSALQGLSEIPQSIQAQTASMYATGKPAQPAHSSYDPQRSVKSIRGVSLATGFSVAIVAGFIGLYFYNSPTAIMTNLKFPDIFEAAMEPDLNSSVPTGPSAQTVNTAPNSDQPLITAVPVTSVALRANPRLAVNAVRGESGTDIPLVIRIDPEPGAKTSIVVNGLPDGASLTAGVESTKGVWVVKPADLETLALRTPLGLSGQYDFDVELVGAEGNMMDRKTFLVALSAQTPSSIPVSATPQNNPDRPLSVENGTDSPNPASARAQSFAATNKVFLASGLSLEDFQKRAKVNGQMIARGDTFLSNGDISSARLLYERSGKDGSAVGATLAAMTYDPISLREQPGNTIRPNAGKAQIWYAKAIGLGSKEAVVRRAALDELLASN